ncbi:MAG: ABC transporter ATP-binding protein, partial [Proteobacteria bacterium]|nr:ABC transporter ATP-binding protein [Pseudomonadota bacterium]
YYLVSLGIDLIGDLIRDRPPATPVMTVTLGIILCVVMRFLVVSYARRAIRRVGIAVSFDLRQRLFQAVQQQGASFFGRMTVGDVMTRAIQDIALIQRLIAFGLISIVIMVYAPLFGVSAMLFKSVSLTLMIVPLLPVIFIYAVRVAHRMGVSSRQVQQRLSDLSAHTQENLSGIRTIQAQVQEENEIRRFWKTNDDYATAFYDQARISSEMSAWMPFFAAMAQLVIIVYGGYQVMQGDISVGDLVFFFACLSMLLQPIRLAGMLLMLLQRAAVATDRLFEIYDAEPEIVDQPSGETPAVIRGDFEIRHLSYTYPGSDTPALEDINFRIRPGESIAIVGRIGAGKSTLLRQFTRMLDTPRGALFIDGHDVNDYPLAQLRRDIAQVLQDPFLFGEPLSSNISYDDPERQLEMIWDAAESASLRQSIEGFPQKLGTLVGERGVTLSGGQKQRTALARGLIRDAPVLILDDCFSSVDTETEEHILKRLKALRADRTTILVSHRISTLRHSDRIIVLDEGRIVESGSHEALLAMNGVYAELERLQTQGDSRAAVSVS